MSHELTLLIVRTSVLLFLSSGCVLLLTRWRPLLNPRWHRLAWGIVLVQGVMLFPFSWRVTRPAWMAEPVNSESLTATSSDHVSVSNDVTMSAPLEITTTAVGPDATRRMEGPESVASMTIGDSPSRIPSDAANPDQPDRPAVSAPETTSVVRFDSAALPPTPRNNDVPAVWPLPGVLARVPLGVMFSFIWASGLTVVMGSLLWHYILLHRSLAQSRPARRSWAREMQGLCLELGLNHEVRLEVHSRLGPFLCWTPSGHRVVVPVSLWNRLSSEERTAVLHHELCHLRRGDLWKAGLARLVVAVHWFNPLAWVSARKFDESAEWSCDAQLATEAPDRVVQLANALLAAAQAGEKSPMLALSVTGGPLFQRVRRLVTWNIQGDTLMQKCLWTSLLVVVAIIGSVRIELAATTVQAADEPGESEAVEADTDTPTETETPTAPTEQLNSPLGEMASRIVVGDNETLKIFVALIQSPTGQIVMADRAAVHAQYASNNADPVSQWEQFLTRHFDQSTDAWTVKPEQGPANTEYVQAVESGIEDVQTITPILQEVAQALAGKPEVVPVLKRFLQHEAAPAFVYQAELRPRLHPGVNELAERFDEHLVRTQSGSYVIRPARRQQVERRLTFIDRLSDPLRRFETELSAWADDLVKGDELHDQFAKTLSRPEFAKYILFSHISEESRLADEELDGLFEQLEEATSDTATGLKLNPESDQFHELQETMQRFSVVWDSRQTLADPLHRLADRIEESDELHRRLKAFLKTDLALMFVAREMEYLPVTADAAAREWLSQIVTKNEAGQYEITLESTEDLNSRVEEFYRQFRDIRRRGRVIDEAAAELADSKTRTAMQSLIGKLLLIQWIEQSAERPEVDGLQLWFGEHFEETPEGLVLREGAGIVLEEVIAEAAEVEKELSKSDF